MLVLSCVLNVILIIVICYLLRQSNFPFCKHDWKVIKAYYQKESWYKISNTLGIKIAGSDYNRFLISAELKCTKTNCNKIRSVYGYEDEDKIDKEDMAKIRLFLNVKEIENGK